jgi:hypothetical protein
MALNYQQRTGDKKCNLRTVGQLYNTIFAKMQFFKVVQGHSILDNYDTEK